MLRAGSCIGPVIEIDECTIIAPGERYHGKVTAYIPPGSDGNLITEIQGSWPDEMTFEYIKDPPSTRVIAVVTFSAWNEGTYAFSFTATDNNGAQNDPKTGRFVVTVKEKVVTGEIMPPQVLSKFSYPNLTEPLDLERGEWYLTCDQPVQYRLREVHSVERKSAGKLLAMNAGKNQRAVPAG
ncbi:uncharacterized protein LOC117112159 [Anneissia japonica]|uniref:uncharacterized protein LOC117112159 n=1 Tax=Anneissia japonica TaxID=1529436 RepID=UPI001425ADBD|nr:uncharacterized protein LOC117112159 [Anneissia japonica]